MLCLSLPEGLRKLCVPTETEVRIHAGCQRGKTLDIRCGFRGRPAFGIWG